MPDPWGAQLQDYRTDLGDDTAAGIPTHITLMPPFEVRREAQHARLNLPLFQGRLQQRQPQSGL